jgi:hypothetical protein
MRCGRRGHGPRRRGRFGNVTGALLGAMVMVVAAAVPAAATPAWSVVTNPSPLAPPSGTIESVACATSTACFAVGDNNGGSTFAEQWDGTAWSLVSLPSPAGTAALIEGVVCPSATSCVAVGRANGVNGTTFTIAPLIEQWDGSSWSVVPNPAASKSGALFAVTCLSSAFCVAVGGNTAGSLTERWNGISWTLVPDPVAASASLRGVACTTTTNCFAVGETVLGPSSKMFVERYNGSSWSAAAFPKPGGTTSYTTLLGVSCPTATTCFMVGSSATKLGAQSKTLIERWNGTGWGIVSSPNAPGSTAPILQATSSELDGVTCLTATDCTAVGAVNATIGFTGGTLIERWNGTRWTIVPSPNPVTAHGQTLGAVACSSDSLCFAAGNEYETHQALMEQWNGTTWSISAPPTGSSQGQFAAVSCLDSTTCFAVGHNDAGPGSQTLIAQGSGTTWSITPSPNPTAVSPSQTTLSGVACASATSCFAVGSYRKPTFALTQLIEHWNGSVWAIVNAPAPVITASGKTFASAQTNLSAVSCPAANSCFAVGWYAGARNKTLALVEHWSGSTWSVVSAPSSGNTETVLNGVSCASASSCFAVGATTSTSLTRTFVDTWNGASWSISPNPNPGVTVATKKAHPFDSFAAVSCATAKSCLAIGSYFTGKKTVALAESWNGTKWSVAPIPNFPDPNILTGVACSTSTSCVAVGTGFTGLVQRAVAEQWNGTSWSAVPVPNPPGASASALNAVSCPSTALCNAVGYFTSANNSNTLVEQYGP